MADDDTREWTDAERQELTSRLRVRVTPAQVAAAKLLVEVNEKLGRDTDPAVTAIANAKRH